MGLGFVIRFYMHVYWIVICILEIQSGMDLSCEVRIRYYWDRCGIELFVHPINSSQFTKGNFDLVMLGIAYNKIRIKY